MTGRKWAVVAAVAVAVVGGAVVWFWPTSQNVTGYPFAHRMAGGEQPHPLWALSPEELEEATEQDAARLAILVARLDTAVEAVEGANALFASDRPEELDADEREAVRMLWWSVVEPLLAIDDMKRRYSKWWGLDYIRHPRLHSRAYAINYAALCAQVDGGQRFLEVVSGNDRIQALLDEAMPDYGLPSHMFRTVRSRLGRTDYQTFVLTGDQWYEQWIEQHLTDGQLRALVDAGRSRIRSWLDAETAVVSAENRSELLQDRLFEQWFPVQREAALWFGDQRLVPQDRRFVSDDQIEEMKEQLRPGDILFERRNWYLSNVGLPGFWPHVALFVGTQDDIRETFDQDEGVQERYGTFSEHLSTNYPRVWELLGSPDAEGHTHSVIEAVGEGVLANSLEHSVAADYVSVLRPRLPLVEIARAIDRAAGYHGRDYDFNFDFATDDTIVCSELVMKAYEPEDETRGLELPFVTIAGKVAVPPTEIVRVFARERESENPQLEFVLFLDGNEEQDRAVEADAATLAASAERPKWDVLQP